MFRTLPSPEIAYRTDFSLLRNARGYRHAVEVGVDRAVFARQFLDRWEGELLLLVDPYLGYGEMPACRTGDLITACVGLATHHGRFKFVMQDSCDASKSLPFWFKPQFVFVDGDHTYEQVKKDLGCWWDVLSDDGILAGHDFTEEWPGILRAVREFADARDLIVFTTPADQPVSWYAYKKQPRTLLRRLFIQDEIPNPDFKEPDERT